MTRLEHRLADLLRQAVADQVDGVSVEQVVRHARRARRARAISATTAAAALVAIVAIAAAALGAPARPQRQSSGGPDHRLAFQGVVIKAPPEWRVITRSSCWPADKTVAVIQQAYCYPALAPKNSYASVAVTSLYAPRYVTGWTGARTTWLGQPAWLARTRAFGVGAVTLALPWLNALVIARSPDPARARALLRLVSVRTLPGLAVPPSASSVFIQVLADRYGYGPHAARVTSARQVRRVLADLRALPPAGLRAECGGSWELTGSSKPEIALITVHAPDGPARTYAAQFGRCEEVVAGTGSAAAVSWRLLADIRRLVPKSGL